MSDLVLIRPHCTDPSKTERLSHVLARCLQGVSYETIQVAEEFTPIQNRKILFAVTLGESGINLELYRILKKIRMDAACLEGCIGAILVDGNGLLYTKSIASQVVASANLSGCGFIGKPLVEGTRGLSNFNHMAETLSTDPMDAYQQSAVQVVERLLAFQYPRKERPNLLLIHSSNPKTSNTIRLWHMVKKHLNACDITEISLYESAIRDCVGCPDKVCKGFGARYRCVFSDIMVEQVYPAMLACDGLMVVCPNYNDAISVNLAAFINRLTALYRSSDFSEKFCYSLVVSGYSGGELVTEQLIRALNMNKKMILPPRFSLMETALMAGQIDEVEGVGGRAQAFARQILTQMLLQDSTRIG